MAMTSSMAYFTVSFLLSLSSPLLSTSNGVNGELNKINVAHSQTQQNCLNSDNSLEGEIKEMKFKVAQLELMIEMTDQELYTKSFHIEQCEKKVAELSDNILRLESTLINLKDAPDKEMIKLFEKQVRELEADMRRNELDIDLLKVREKDREETVKLLASKVEMMAKIIPELWFHVQKLEQAREVIERRTTELQRRLRNEKCSFFKFINKFPGRHYQAVVVLYTSEALNRLKGSFSAVKKYHHQLQGLVKQEMERNEFTAVAAGDELIFFLVSVIVVFPFILAVRWLLSVLFLASSMVIFLFTLALRLLSSTFFGCCYSCFISHICFEMIIFTLENRDSWEQCTYQKNPRRNKQFGR